MEASPFCFTELTSPNSGEKVSFNFRLQDAPDYFVTHRHNFVEFTYVIKGHGEETVNNKKHILSPGTFSILLPYQVHSIFSEAGNPISFYLGAISLDTFLGSDSMLANLAELFIHSDEELPAFIDFEGESQIRMNKIFEDMLQCFTEVGVHHDLLFKARLLEAFVTFDMHRRCDVKLEKKDLSAGTRHSNNFWKVIHYIQMHYGDPITLKMLSERFSLSIPYISSAFKQHIGVNYLEFLNEVRIQNARALLSMTDLSITSVAFEVGYESYDSFLRAFHKRMGVSAREYLKQTKTK